MRYIREEQLSSDGGVVKKVITRGESGGEDCRAIPGQTVVIEYEARLENGLVVDRSKDHEKDGKPFSIVVGLGQVIEGWDMGMMSMYLGEKSDIFIQPQYAYGEEGRKPKIPANAPVIFRIELLQVGSRKCRRLERRKRPDATLMTEAQTQKNHGNEFFKDKKYDDAVGFYSDALESVDCV